MTIFLKITLDNEENIREKPLTRPEEIAKLRNVLSTTKNSRRKEESSNAGFKTDKPYNAYGNQTEVEVLSVMHEKDLEILDLKNHILKYELEFKQIKDELKQKNEALKTKENAVEKLRQERDNFEKEIEYLKVFNNFFF